MAPSKPTAAPPGPIAPVGSSTSSATTYATRHLQDGIDIRTLQQWMGHRDIASTMVYLKGAIPGCLVHGCDGHPIPGPVLSQNHFPSTSSDTEW
ncbi:MAG: hypothetical protein DMG69_15505 [Acidobacteria bacterium]|nr:MAG: hypothetical protein DMG69_15505 [Acidobacteriota bacterium]